MRGLSIAFLSCRLMAMAFMGFMGIKFPEKKAEASENPVAIVEAAEVETVDVKAVDVKATEDSVEVKTAEIKVDAPVQGDK